MCGFVVVRQNQFEPAVFIGPYRFTTLLEADFGVFNRFFIIGAGEGLRALARLDRAG